MRYTISQYFRSFLLPVLCDDAADPNQTTKMKCQAVSHALQVQRRRDVEMSLELGGLRLHSVGRAVAA